MNGEPVQVVATDEFWDGESFDLTRLPTEVVEPLARGAAAPHPFLVLGPGLS